MTEERRILINQYFMLANSLEKVYPESSFKNHCYWRIALDNVLSAKWDTVISRPAYASLSQQQLEKVIQLLKFYMSDQALLTRHNLISLSYRSR
ncbi:MAG: acetyltransferase [Bacteroidota bacterium]